MAVKIAMRLDLDTRYDKASRHRWQVTARYRHVRPLVGHTSTFQSSCWIPLHRECGRAWIGCRSTIQPILFKSAIYWLCVLLLRLAEGLVHFLAAGGPIGDFPDYLVEYFSWSRFLSIQIWLMVLFLVYVTIHELNMLFGNGELSRLFFRWRSSEAKLTRRQRIRLLTQLNRLTEAHPIEAFSERGSPVHTELVSRFRSSYPVFE
jgi:hypothetical protein